MINQSKLCVPNAGLGVGPARLVAAVDMATRMPGKGMHQVIASGYLWLMSDQDGWKFFSSNKRIWFHDL